MMFYCVIFHDVMVHLLNFMEDQCQNHFLFGFFPSGVAPGDPKKRKCVCV